jgi:hypothetical protein
MSLVDVTVELGLDSGGGATKFILDSDSMGILGVDQLGGLVFNDVTQYVKSLSTTRGRSRQLDYYNAGVATVTFDNRSREFDPVNEDSSLYPGIEPRGLLRITSANQPVFYGYVNDWDLEYDLVENDVATAFASDAFSILSNQLLSAFTPSAELTGARVNTVLNRSEVDFVGGRNVDTGQSTLGAYAVAANTNVLNYLRQIERSEIGNFYISRTGDIEFRDRSNVPNEDLLLFADDGTGINYQSLFNEYGDELLYNYIRLKSPAGVEQVKSDITSINRYQISQLAYDDLLNSTTTDVASIANVFLSKFKNPKIRFTGLQVQLVGLSDEDAQKVLSLDLADYIQVKKSFGFGTPASLTQILVVSGISHQIKPDSHVVQFSFDGVQDSVFLILGSTDFGILDSGILDF